MRVIKDKYASIIPESGYPVNPAAVLKRGQVLVLADGHAVPAAAEESGEILGICLENHSGTAGVLNPGGNAAKVRVADGPGTIYACAAPRVTATSNGTNRLTVSTLGEFETNDFTDGYVKLEKKSENSANTSPVGMINPVTNFNIVSKAFIINTSTSAGDEYSVYPPLGSSVGALDSESMKLTLDTASEDLSLKVVGHDFTAGEIFIMAKRHILANSVDPV
jgi:hypothetical protein